MTQVPYPKKYPVQSCKVRIFVGYVLGLGTLGEGPTLTKLKKKGDIDYQQDNRE